MAGLTGGVAALLGAVDRRRDIDAEAEVSVLYGLDEILGVDAVVEDSGDGGGGGQAVDDTSVVGGHVAVPVRGRRHVPARTERASIERIAHVDRLKRQRHFEKLLELGQASLVILSPAGDCEDHVIVVEALGVAVAMKCVGHDVYRAAATGSSFLLLSSGVLLTLPSPILVFARARL